MATLMHKIDQYAQDIEDDNRANDSMDIDMPVSASSLPQLRKQWESLQEQFRQKLKGEGPLIQRKLKELQKQRTDLEQSLQSRRNEAEKKFETNWANATTNTAGQTDNQSARGRLEEIGKTMR